MTLTEPPGLTEIEPHLFLFQGRGAFNVNSLVLEDAAGLTLIDTQLEDENNRALIGAIRGRWPDAPLLTVLISHYHLDHYLGLPFFRAAFGDFAILGPPNARSSIDACTPVIWESYLEHAREHSLAQSDVIYPAREVDGPIELSFSGRRFEGRLAGPNEAWATITGYLPDTRTLFASDLYFGGIYIDPRIGGTVLGWRAEVRRLLELPCERVISGHSNRLHTRAELEAFADSLDMFVDEARGVVAGGTDLPAFLAHSFASDLAIYSREFSLSNIYRELAGAA